VLESEVRLQVRKSDSLIGASYSAIVDPAVDVLSEPNMVLKSRLTHSLTHTHTYQLDIETRKAT